MIVTGVQQALNVAAHLFVRGHSRVVMEAPGCSVTARLFKVYGAKVSLVPVDQNGIVAKQLPESPSLAFVTPMRHYPMGVVLSATRRDEVLIWAHQTNSHIIELDFDTEFDTRVRRQPP